MHTDRGIVRMYRCPYSLSTKPDDQNTLTCQSADTNYAPRYPVHVPVISYEVCNKVCTIINTP